MSSKGVIVGTILGGLVILGVAAAITSLGRWRSGKVPLGGQFQRCKDASEDNVPRHTAGQTRIIARSCVLLLAPLMNGLLDVGRSCSVHESKEEGLSCILKALVDLNAKMDAALLEWQELVTSLQSNPQWHATAERLLTAGSLLGTSSGKSSSSRDNIPRSTKRILARVHLVTGTPSADTFDSTRSAVEDFADLNKIYIKDIIALWAPRSDSDGAAKQHPPSLISTQLGPQDDVKAEKELGKDAYDRHQMDGLIDDLHEAIDHFNKALALCPLEHYLRPSVVFDAAYAIYTRFKILGQQQDLEKAIVHFRGAVELFPPGHRDHQISLGNLSFALQIRFRRWGQIDDLEEAVIYERDNLELCPPGHPGRSMSLNNLAYALGIRFDQLGDMADLEQSIAYQRDALELHPPGHPDRHLFLSNLAPALQTRFDQLGQMADLEQAIIYNREVLDLRPPEHPELSTTLNNLATALRVRFDQLGEMADLEMAITHLRSALELCPQGHPDRSRALNNLASSLGARFRELGQMVDLEQAIIHHRDALELRPLGHPDRHSCFNNLALALQVRFRQLGQMADLEQVIIYHRSALELCPYGHPDRSVALNNLAAAFGTRFDHLGQMEDLEHAISYHRDGLELRGPGHPHRHSSLSNLAITLQVRFRQLGQMVDLEQAIMYHQEALELCPAGHSGHSTSLDNLAVALSTRFDQLGQVADLEQAIIYHRCALELRPPGHPDRSKSLNNLASTLETRFSHLGQMVDLDQAICYHYSALELCPTGHPDRSTSLGHLAIVLDIRFRQSGQMHDLEQSVIYHREALALRPPGHPYRSTSRIRLSLALETRFEKLKHAEDMLEAVELLRAGSIDASDTPAHRYACASQLVALLSLHNQPRPVEVYEMALNLLQLSLAVYPDVELRRKALGTDHLSPSLAMLAAAYAIEQGQPEKAVEMLEQGRALLWSNFRGYRHPVEAVRQVDPTLADRFQTASKQLEALATSVQLGSEKLQSEGNSTSAALSEARWARQRELSSERDEIIQKIRQLDGFQHFLEAVPFSELRNAATKGPIIVVNISQERSDAIILCQRDIPIVLPLSTNDQNRTSVYFTLLGLSKLLSEERGKIGFSDTLENTILKELADLVVTPILEKLEELGVPEQSRIWWCPTSALCALPIHAAGRLPDKYISSYTPTLSALINARTSSVQNLHATAHSEVCKPSLLAIIHPGHPPQSKEEPDGRLRMVFAERQVLQKAGGAHQVHSLVKADATRQAVLDQLPDHPWVHFACHGRLNTSQPFRSAFELEDDPLALSDLVHARLPDADFAFLAACDSATSGGTSDTPDESLHLAAAVQFCGVRSVVGTLWPMADEDGPRVAQVFYRHMFKENDSRKSAEALHKVVLAMRRRTGPWAKTQGEGELLQRWANYIHIGA
ncbi:hypothetical protein HWV62_11257 [Athelia sp. TMB]|nr:hypothetical protein HWV62_11257 [Athelia sp. TMB]